MRSNDALQLILFIAALVAAAKPLGSFIARVAEGQKTFLSPALGWLERLAYRASGVDETREMSWREYAAALLWFNAIGALFVFGLQMGQRWLPLNPQGFASPTWHSALNTAVSFMTNTNWQGYAGETTMSYLTQMAGLGVQNFLSAATGMAVVFAFARGVARKNSVAIGNFWADAIRSVLYVLLPLSFALALAFLAQGVIQTTAGYVDALTLEGAKQTIALGPVASQEAIKQIGTNGGGFFNANSSHPFENPTPFSNFLQMLAIFLIPAALTYAYGSMARARRHGWTIFCAMLALFIAVAAGALLAEQAQNPLFAQGGLMEGKETRFGVFGSVLYSAITTSASCGAVNAMHSSLSPLAGALAMFNMMVGEVIFGGVGSGLYGMLMFVVLTVFLAGLMVGRSPEYLGKKIEAGEMKWVMAAVLGPCAVILIAAAVSAVLPAALSSLANKGPHGFSEILYAFVSSAANNGSAFAGLNANTLYFNLTTAVAMLIGRFVVIVPALAIAGRLAGKNSAPPSAGTFSTDSAIFAILLIGVIVIVGALTFLPALSLGPIVEHFLMLQGRAF